MTTQIVPSITDDKIAELKSVCDSGNFISLHVSVRELTGLIARLRHAEKDAARYRYIRCAGSKPGFLSSDPAKAKYLDEYLVCESVMDARIDTAMEQSK